MLNGKWISLWLQHTALDHQSEHCHAWRATLPSCFHLTLSLLSLARVLHAVGGGSLDCTLCGLIVHCALLCLVSVLSI
uniref:Uncharacterized protein n=1 Tax=Anguilla anguilla TaxID=7936 RepID=A0A0E9WPG8_ANGAN